MMIILFAFLLIGMIHSVLAIDSVSCCEKTNYGAWCQEVSNKADCNPSFRILPTSCEATSFCKLGCCYDSDEGVCMDNTPQKVCQDAKGSWSDNSECNIPQCNLGCCVLGSQAAFVSLTRCKKLSGFYGLITDFRSNINSELSCIATTATADEGACVFDVDYGKACKFTSRQECNSIQEGTQLLNGTVTGNITFYKDDLCSKSKLLTGCGMTTKTTCIAGKEEVYFVDSCGNPANIYDASKIDDQSYWENVIPKEESCGTTGSNAKSTSCGNCNYFGGSLCSKYDKTRPSYGDYICNDLNCKGTTGGDKLHGESWCSTDANKNAVGSEYFRHLCLNGQEIIEPCASFRQEICLQDSLNGFSQANCVVNRWQDCIFQTVKKTCENSDKRDCKWVDKQGGAGINCVPLYTPGLNFWTVGDASTVCSQGTITCSVKEEDKLIGGQKVTDGAECLKDEWKQQQIDFCASLGDCSYKINYLGNYGEDTGYNISQAKVPSGSGGGLFGINLILNKIGLTGEVVEENDKEN